MSGRNILQHVRQSAVLIYGFPCHCSVISREVSNLKCNCQRQAYAQGYTSYSQGYTGIGVDKIPCPWHTPGFIPYHHIAEEDTTTHVSFTISFHVYAQRAFPCRRRAQFQASQLRSVTRVSVTHRIDNTTRLSHGKGHKTTARQARYTHRHCWTWSGMCMSPGHGGFLSFPKLRVITGFSREEIRVWTMFSALFRGVCTTKFFTNGLENRYVRVDKFLKMAPFIISKRVSSKNLNYFQEKLIHSKRSFCSQGQKMGDFAK